MARTDPRERDIPPANTPLPARADLEHPSLGAESDRPPDLDLLVPVTTQDAWFCSLLRQLRGNKSLPPLELTSRPVAVKEIWGAYDRRGRGFLSSGLVHVAAVVLLFTAMSNRQLQRVALESVDLVVPVDVSRFLIGPSSPRGGGSGGLNSPLPASRGRLPRFDEHQIAPALLKPIENARLEVEPTLLGPSDIRVLNLDLAMFGDPLAAVGPPSHGPGDQGGFGNRSGTGVGPSSGPGYGPGPGGGGVYRIGGGVAAPVLTHRVDPEYSDAARKSKLQGTVVLVIEVWPDGRAHNIRIERGLGLGLDEQAVRAVEQWLFKPGTKDGSPVSVGARVEVNFRLL